MAHIWQYPPLPGHKPQCIWSVMATSIKILQEVTTSLMHEPLICFSHFMSVVYEIFNNWFTSWNACGECWKRRSIWERTTIVLSRTTGNDKRPKTFKQKEREKVKWAMICAVMNTVQFKVDRLQIIVVAKNITVLLLFISRMPKMCAIPQLVSAPLNPIPTVEPVSYTHLRAHETREDLVCRLLLEKKK